ncbi:MAG: thiol:disulfide interchange protein DsbA/DsbL [Gammaproteobacteria bacterium]|jgi:protein dithiol oxidoreductase (disulfide-forming)
MKNWVIGICTLALLPGLAIAAPSYKEKIHYELVMPAQPTSTDKKVEVVEVFLYTCPHCNNLEPYVHRWLKKIPPEAEFVRMPAVFQPKQELLARAYYAAEILGVLEKIHPAMFEAIHQQKRHFNTDADVQKLFVENGVSEKDFNRVFRSFAVEAKIRRAKDMSQRYGIPGVPALIVDGKYRTGARLAGGNANIFRVVDFLVAKESSTK